MKSVEIVPRFRTDSRRPLETGWSPRAAAALVAGVMLLSLTACSRSDADRFFPDRFTIDDPAAINDIHLDLPILEPEEWVERYEPERSWPGYHLVLYHRRMPMLVDMSGAIVHAWPLVRATARARLLPDGSLLVTGIDNLIKRYDWDGELIWYHRLERESDLAHHDVIVLANGNVLVLALEDSVPKCDYLEEVDPRGRSVWRWRMAEHIDAHFPERDREVKDPSHINSIHELGPNRWYDSGDERFRPGNILVSARALNAIFIIDRRSGEIAWKHRRGLDGQHEARMIPEGHRGQGNILVFNNGLRNRFGYRRSSIVALDPIARRVVWSYRHMFFYSSIAGAQQLLPNGNLLITSSHGGRVFEITERGDIVWQWIPPWLPMRVARYSDDHCPQLAELRTAQDRPVPPKRKRPYISRDLHQFAVSGEYKSRIIAGKRRQLVRDPNSCRALVLPGKPFLSVNYGLHEARLKRRVGGARFVLSLAVRGEAEPRILIDEEISTSSDEQWRERWILLPRLGHRRAEMCLRLETFGEVDLEGKRPLAAFEVPRVYSGLRPQLPRKPTDPELTEQERELRERQLRALGYIQ